MDDRTLLTGVGALLALGAPASAQNMRPNVIVIYTDDHGTLDMNCYGARDLRTPHMDTLAARGVRFTQFYAAPVSSASRASLMTGHPPPVRDLRGMPGTGACRRTRRRLPSVCGQTVTGQPVSASGTWGRSGVCSEQSGDSIISGDFWEAASTAIRISTIGEVRTGTTSGATIGEIYRGGTFFAEETLREAERFITNGDERPFFLYWAVNIPHYPLQPSEKWLEYYADLPEPRRQYAAFISTFDDCLGGLRAFLRENGLEENTIVILQSDNGHSTEVRTFGGGGYCGDYRGGKFSLFEGGNPGAGPHLPGPDIFRRGRPGPDGHEY